MQRENIVDRIATEVCLAIEASLGPFADCHALHGPISAAIRHCIFYGPHCEQHGVEPTENLVQRVRRSVETVLTVFQGGRPPTDVFRADIEAAIRYGIRGTRLQRSA